MNDEHADQETGYDYDQSTGAAGEPWPESADTVWIEEHKAAVKLQQQARAAVLYAGIMRGGCAASAGTVLGLATDRYTDALKPAVQSVISPLAAVLLLALVVVALIFGWVYAEIKAARMATTADFGMWARDFFASPGMRQHELQFISPPNGASDIPEVKPAKGNARGRAPRLSGGAIASFIARAMREGLESASNEKNETLGRWLLEEFEALGQNDKPSLTNAAKDARAALDVWISSTAKTTAPAL